MAEKNSLWKNIRANRGSGKEPTKEMLDQEKKIKATYPDGGTLGSKYKTERSTTATKNMPALGTKPYRLKPGDDPGKDSFVDDVVEIFDPTGITSWDDALAEDADALDKFSAVPLFGKAAKVLKAIKSPRTGLSVYHVVKTTEAKDLIERVDTPKKPNAEGGYMYNQGGPFNPDGGTYANKQGVIMGPVENPDGSYTLPVSTEGLPQVNLPEFEVALESNPYGPVTGDEYLNSNFNPLNWIFSSEPYQQQFRPDGTLIPASGRVDIDNTLPLAFMGAKPNYANFERGVNKVVKNFSKKTPNSNNLQQSGFINTKGAFQKYPKGALTEEEIEAYKNSFYYKQSTKEHEELVNKYGSSWKLPNYADEQLQEAIASGKRSRINPILYGGRNWEAGDYTIAGLAGTAYPAYLGVTGLAFSPPAVKNKVLNAAGITSVPGSLSSRDTTIDLTNRNMDFAKVNETADGQMILGGEFIENANNTVRKAKDWLSATDTYSDKEYPSKTIQSFYGIEDGKFKVGKASDFESNTEIVPRRFGKTGINQAILNDGAMRLLDNQKNPIYQNTPNTGKFILYSPSTKKSEFNYISSGKKGVDKVNKFLKENKDAEYIHLDNGRYEFYGLNSKGLSDQDFKNYYEQDLGREGTPGYNLILKAEGGYINPYNQYAQGGYMYNNGGGIGEDGDPVTLYKKAEYNSNTDKILEYAGSEDNKYYVTPNTPQGIDFESRLPEFEIIQDTGLYNPDTSGYTAPRFIPSETGLISNPNYRPLATGALDPVYPEAVLLPGNLPIKATSTLGKIGVGLLEAAIENPGLGVSSVVKNVGKEVEKYGKRVLRSNYNPLSVPIKNVGTKIARISDNQYRDYKQILDALKGKSQSRYFGQHLNQDDFSDIKYGINDRDLNKTYFKGDKTNLKELDYDTSKDLGLKSSEDWYGKLNAYELNSEIPNSEKLDIIDFLKSMNYYQWNEADGFKTGQYVLSEGIENLMKDYPGENLLNLGKLTGNKRIGLETFNDEQLKVVKDNLRHLFEKHGSDKIPFEVGKAKPSTEGIQLFGSPVKPIDDIAGHMGFLERNPVTGDINYTTRDVWGFNPKAYSEKYRINRKGEKIKPFEKLQVHLMDSFGKPFILHQTNPIKFKGGGYTNPYMYYSGGPMEYGRGGNFLKHVGAGAYALGEGLLDTITGGATDQITDKGFEWLTKVGNKNMDLSDPANAKFLKTQQQIKGYGNTTAAVGAGIVTGNVQGAIQQGAKGLNTAFQASDWASDDFKKWSGISSKAIGIGAGLAGGSLNATGTSASASEAAAKVGEIGGKVSPYVNQAVNMFGSKQQPMWQQAQAEQDRLNSPEYKTLQDFNNQQYVNQGLSFSHGGHTNNEKYLVNLQNNSMRNRYNNYRQKYKDGGKLEGNGISEIPSYVGLHKDHPRNGMQLGPNSSVEGSELIQYAEGGAPGLSNPTFVHPANVDGEENIKMPEMTSNYEMITDKYDMPKFSKKSPAQWLKEKLNRGSEFRTEVDSRSKHSGDQVKQIAEGGREVAMSVNELKNQQLIEEEYIAAYGGRINPKKYPGLNRSKKSKGGYVYNAMTQPMLAHGGPVVSNIQQPFNGPAAQNRGGMMMANGGMMQQQGGQDQMMQLIQAYAQAMGIPPEEILQQLQQMDPKSQEQAMQQMAQELQGSQQQSMQQQMPPQQGMMARGGRMRYDGGGPYDLPGMVDMSQSEYDFINNLSIPNVVDNQGNTSSILSRSRVTPGNDSELVMDPTTNAVKNFNRDTLKNIQSKSLQNQYIRNPKYSIPEMEITGSIESMPEIVKNINNSNSYTGAGTGTPKILYAPKNPTQYTTTGENNFNLEDPFASQNTREINLPDSNSFTQGTIPIDIQNIVSNQTSNNNSGSTTPWYEEPAYSKAARYLPLLTSAAGIATGLKNKKRSLTPERISPEQINLERSRITSMEEGRRALDSGLRNVRGSSSNTGQLAANTRDMILNYNKNMGANIAKSYESEENTNAQLRQQSSLANQQYGNQFKQLNEEMFQNAQTMALRAAQEGAMLAQSGAEQERKQYLQEWIAKNRLKTRNMITGPDGEDYYYNPSTKKFNNLNTGEQFDSLT